MIELVRKIESMSFRFWVNADGRQMKIAPEDVYYIENVERKLFVYLIKDVYRLDGTIQEISLVLELFGLAFLITVLNHLIDNYLSLSILQSYIVRYIAITGVVMLFGFIAGWFYPSNFWMAFLYVGVVLVLAYCIDSFRVKKDIDYINQQIAARSDQLKKEETKDAI